MSAAAPRKIRVRRYLFSGLRVAVAVFVGFSVVLYFFQDRLLFHPQPLSEATRSFMSKHVPGTREITLTANDGVELHGWMRRFGAASRAPLLLYFGGNAEEVSAAAADAAGLEPWALAAFNYRGYGLSGGKPGERQMQADALLVHDQLTRRDDIDPERVAVLGRSLGSAVAVYLAAERPVLRIVLVTPFDSVTRVAKRRYPSFPIGLLIRHPFDSLSRAPSIASPLLVLAAGQDRVVPSHHARALFDAWGGPKRWHLMSGAGHASIVVEPDYWPTIAGFLHEP